MTDYDDEIKNKEYYVHNIIYYFHMYLHIEDSNDN